MDYPSYFKFWTKVPKIREKIITNRYSSVFEIPYKKLSQQGVKLLIFDVDDTLTDHHGELSSKMILFLQKLSAQFKIAFLTNRRSKKREKLYSLINAIRLHIEPCSKKPSAHCYLDVIRRFGLKSTQVAMIGDRVGTDLWGAFNSEIPARILITPYSKRFTGKKANMFIMLFRWLEKKYALTKHDLKY